MYIDTLAYQTRVFLYSYGFGFILGILYDVFRILRLLVYNGRKKIFFWDIAYTLVASFSVVIFSLAVCRGVFGFYLLLGIFLGFATYYFAFGCMIVKFSNRLIFLTKKFFSKIILCFKKVFCKIMVRFKKISYRTGEKIRKKSKKVKNKSKYLLQVDKVMLYNNKK